jgi:hypothetical protein
MCLRANRESYSLALQGKNLYSALYGAYTVTINELKSLLKASSQAGQSNQGDGSRKYEEGRHLTAEAARSPKKAAIPISAGQVPTKNFFASSGQAAWTLTLLSRCPTPQRRRLQKNLDGRPQ